MKQRNSTWYHPAPQANHHPPKPANQVPKKNHSKPKQSANTGQSNDLNQMTSHPPSKLPLAPFTSSYPWLIGGGKNTAP
jgi:hypothetical protein